MKNLTKLKERASRAFDATFRDRLANAVTRFLLTGGRINTVIATMYDKDCRCPEGCLTLSNHPPCSDMSNWFGFTANQHADFQVAFDGNHDSGTPEAALGLLYRKRFIKNT